MKSSLLFRFSIFCIVILGLNINISKAWTWEEFINLLNSTKDIQTENTLKTAGNYILNNRTYVENKLISLGINIEDYSSIVISPPSSSIVAFDLWLYTKNNSNGSWYIDNNSLKFSNFNTTGIHAQIFYPNYNSNKQSYTFNNSSIGKVWGLLDTEPINNSFGNLILQNAYNYINIVPRDNLSTSNLPWYIGER